DSGAAGAPAAPGYPRPRRPSPRRRADGRKTAPPILATLCRLDQHASSRGHGDAPALTKFRDAREHAVGTLRGLDREHARIGHNHRLADVERTGCIEQSEPFCNVGTVPLAGTLAPEGSFRHQDFWRDCVRSHEAKAVLFEDRRDAFEQMVIAAAEDAVDSGQQPKRLEIRPDLPDRRPHHRADENHVAAALLARKPTKPAELAYGGPVMRVACDPLRVRPTANGEKHHAAPALAYRIGDRNRQASAAANHCQRTVVCRACGCRVAHASSSTDARRTAMVNGRVLARMKAITLATSGSSPLCAATWSSRSRNVPAPKNIAS